MPKNKHYFVPRFYLGTFQSAPRRINVLGVDTSREIQDASLRDQCYRHKFYGQADKIEDALGLMESHAARVLKAIQSTEMLLAEGTEEHGTLLAFVAFQLLRTAVVADRINTVIDKTTKQVHSHDSGSRARSSSRPSSDSTTPSCWHSEVSRTCSSPLPTYRATW